MTILKQIRIFSGFEDFRVTAWDLHSSMESNEVRWTTQIFRIPSPNCHGANFLSRMKNIGCKYENLTFGAGQDLLKSFPNVTTFKKCFELCVKESCSTYALDMGTKSLLYISPTVSHFYGRKYITLVKSSRIYAGQYTFPNLLLYDDNMLGEHKEREKNVVYGRLF